MNRYFTTGIFSLAIIGFCLVAYLGLLIPLEWGQRLISEWQRWQPFATPPESATQILTIYKRQIDSRSVDVYVETVTSKIYRCCRQATIWEKVDVLPSDPQAALSLAYLGYHSCFNPDDPRFTHLPAKVIDCAAMNWSPEYILDDELFVLLEDNSIWRWQRNGANAIWVYIGLVAVAFIGYLWVVRRTLDVLRAKKKPSSMTPPDLSHTL